MNWNMFSADALGDFSAAFDRSTLPGFHDLDSSEVVKCGSDDLAPCTREGKSAPPTASYLVYNSRH